MPAPTPPSPIASVPATPDRTEGQDIFVGKMFTFLDYFAPLKAYLQDVVTYASDAVTYIAGLATSADANATSAAASKTAAEAAAASALSNSATQATSTSSITPAIGSNAFTLAQTGKSFVVGQFVSVADSTTPSTKFFNGAITAFNAGTGAITVDARVVVGTGSGSSWVITASAPAQSENFVSPVQNFVALGNVSGAVAIDLRNGLACSMTITGNVTFTFTMPALFGSGKSTWWLATITRSGSYTMGFPVGTEWHDGAQPVYVVGQKGELLLTWDNGSSTAVGSKPRNNIS